MNRYGIPNYKSKSFLMSLYDPKKKVPYEYGTRWMCFYIYYRFPIGFVLSGLSILGQFISLFMGNNDINYYTVFSVCADSVLYIFSILVYLEMKRRTLFGYRSNLVLIFVQSIIAISNNILYSIVPWSIWIILNTIYFAKRRIIFEDTKMDTKSSPLQAEKSIESPIERPIDPDTEKRIKIDIAYSEFSTEDKKSIEDLDKIIETLETTYKNALQDLNGITREDLELLYHNGSIDEERYNDIKQSYESLMLVKETYPKLIRDTKLQRVQIIKKYLC